MQKVTGENILSNSNWSKKELIIILSVIIIFLAILLFLLKILNLDIIYSSIIFDTGFFLVTLFLFVYFLRNKNYSFFTPNISFKWFLISLLLFIFVVIVGGKLSELLSIFLNIKNDSISKELLSDNLWLNILQFKILTSLLVPITEELIFRGLIFKFIRQYRGFIFSAVISSLIFGVLHFNIAIIPFVFLLGFVNSFMLEKTNSLFYPIIIHALVNSVAASMFFYTNIV